MEDGGVSQIHHEGEDDLELPDLPASGIKSVPLHMSIVVLLYGPRIQTQSIMHTRKKTHYHLSYASKVLQCLNSNQAMVSRLQVIYQMWGTVSCPKLLSWGLMK